MSDQHHNNLTPAQAEALAILAEECAEAIQVVGKILRNGLAGYHPNDPTKRSNRALLEKELGDIRAASVIAASLGICQPDQITEWSKQKLRGIDRYLHHIELRWTAPVEDDLAMPAQDLPPPVCWQCQLTKVVAGGDLCRDCLVNTVGHGAG